jgi:hypothetical protein
MRRREADGTDRCLDATISGDFVHAESCVSGSLPEQWCLPLPESFENRHFGLAVPASFENRHFGGDLRARPGWMRRIHFGRA